MTLVRFQSRALGDQIKMNSIHFADPCPPKITHHVFPTIRRTTEYGDAGDDVTITAGEDSTYAGSAEIVGVEERLLKDLDEQFLTYDTNTDDWESAIRSLQSHWDDPIGEEEVLCIYWIQWRAVQPWVMR